MSALSFLLDKIDIEAYLYKHQLSILFKSIQKTLVEKPLHGDHDKWHQVFDQLPTKQALQKAGAIQTQIDQCVHFQADFEAFLSEAALEEQLMRLSPWRKGPFQCGNIKIETEWDSYLKWQRVLDSELDLKNKTVLDVGCGNGYFMWQAQKEGAKAVIGVDPSWLFYMQFLLFQRYIQADALLYLPMGIEGLAEEEVFDVIFSMGVLYHRKSPLEHLFSLKNRLKNSGKLVLETIVLNDHTPFLTPADRYAGMRNVWMLTDVDVLCSWLLKVGFKITYQSEVVKTTEAEQKQTKWMTFHSLADFLNEDKTKTIEGLPAPHRVMIICEK